MFIYTCYIQRISLHWVALHVKVSAQMKFKFIEVGYLKPKLPIISQLMVNRLTRI